VVLLESNKTRLCVDAFLCSCSAYLLWVDAIAKLQWRICWSLVFMQVMLTRCERVLCTGAGSETCLLVLIRPLVAGTLSLCRSRNGTPRLTASPCRKPVARCLVCCPRSPAVAARGWTTSDDSSLPSSTGIVSGATFICCSLIREVDHGKRGPVGHRLQDQNELFDVKY